MSSTEAVELAEGQVESDTVAGLGEIRWWRLLKRYLVVHAVLLYFLALRFFEWVGLRRLFHALNPRRSAYEKLTGPVAMRRGFEILGPIYVKLGQLVASGEALFPAAYSDELQALLDEVPPFPFDEIDRALVEELGAPVNELLGSIERDPIAAASIAQVHGATLPDGTEIVVKVQRPGIRALAAADITLLKTIARLAARISKYVRRVNAVGAIEDFEQNLIRELDFRNEAARMRDFNAIMTRTGNDTVGAPAVYGNLSGQRVLSMERFRGWSLGDREAVLAQPFDAEERLLTGMRAWFQTLIFGGFFHGDVHAGNFMLLSDGRVGFLDFGIVGTFDDDAKKNVLDYVLAFQSRDFKRLANAMISMGTVDSTAIDCDRFAADLEEGFAPMLDPHEGFRMRELLPSLLRVSLAHDMRMPQNLVLITKQLVYLDRYSRAYGGPTMNVLTNQRLHGMIMQDMLAAMAG